MTLLGNFLLGFTRTATFSPRELEEIARDRGVETTILGEDDPSYTLYIGSEGVFSLAKDPSSNNIVPVIFMREGFWPYGEDPLFNRPVTDSLQAVFFHELAHALYWLEFASSFDTVEEAYEAWDKLAYEDRDGPSKYKEESDTWDQAKDLAGEYGINLPQDAIDHSLNSYDESRSDWDT